MEVGEWATTTFPAAILVLSPPAAIGIVIAVVEGGVSDPTPPATTIVAVIVVVMAMAIVIVTITAEDAVAVV